MSLIVEGFDLYGWICPCPDILKDVHLVYFIWHGDISAYALVLHDSKECTLNDDKYA